MTSTTGTPLADLLRLELREQASWATAIPAWHPRNETTPPPADPPADPPPADPPADPPASDDDSAPSGLTKAEERALRKQADDAQKAAAKAARTQRERERAAAAQAGNFEELYNDANGRVEKVTGLVRTNAITSGVAAAAERLGFNTPSLAARLIDTNDLTVEVDLDADTFPELDSAAQTLIERRLTEVAQREPGLLREGPGRMLPGAGQGNGGGQGDGGNAAMNSAIRRAAGRA